MFNLATSLEHLGKTSESVEVLRRAHQLAPGDAAISASLGAGLVKLGKKGEAESLITSAGGLPKNKDAWSGYTRATGAVRRKSQRRSACTHQSGVEHQTGLSRGHCFVGQPDVGYRPRPRGTEGRRGFFDGSSGQRELLNTTGLLAMAQMHVSEAEAAFSAALAKKPEYLDAKTNHAVSLLLQHRRAPAVAEFQEVIKTDPRNLKAQANLATALYEMARYREACDAFAKAVDLSPRTPTFVPTSASHCKKPAEPPTPNEPSPKLSACGPRAATNCSATLGNTLVTETGFALHAALPHV